MDIFGHKTQKLLHEAQKLILEAQNELNDRVSILEKQQETTHKRLEQLETKNYEFVLQIDNLEKTVSDMRISAIRGEIASGQKSIDVAKKYGVTPARISQIAPRRRYNNG